MSQISNLPIALTIAGSDSGGGAGIQADLRTFAMHCVHGTSAVTCVTAQNTMGVNRVDAMSEESIVAQMEAVIEDIGVQAVKTGMLLNEKIIAAVSQKIKELQVSGKIAKLVVDPVMVSRTGARLIDKAALEALQEKLIPLATIITPNRHEASILAGLEIQSLQDMEKAARILVDECSTKAVLVKGGGMSEDILGIDIFFDGNSLERLKTEQIKTKHTHGTGCTLSAAIAANLAKGKSLLISVKEGKQYVTQALQYSLAIGSGQGPVGHFFPLLESSK